MDLLHVIHAHEFVEDGGAVGFADAEADVVLGERRGGVGKAELADDGLAGVEPGIGLTLLLTGLLGVIHRGRRRSR